MVSHQEAVPAADEAKAGIPGREKQQDQGSHTQDQFPGNRDQPAGFAGHDGQHAQGHDLGVKPQPGPQARVQRRGPVWVAVTDQREGHAVEIVKAVAQGVMAVVVA